MASKLASLLQKIKLYEPALYAYRHWMALRNRLAVSGVLPLLVSCKWLRRLHYGLFSNSFDHEMKMYAHARLTYLKSVRVQTNDTLLRRQIHGLEKGLMNEPRKPVFALDYIQNTVKLFASFAHHSPQNSALLDWSSDVLTLYFQSVEPHATVKDAYEIFKRTNYRKSNDQLFVPYQMDRIKMPEHSAELFERLVYARKSVRWFLPQIPPRTVIDKAIELALLAPSSCNRQPYAFHVFDDPHKVKALMELAPGAGGFRDQVPVVVAVIGKMNVSPSAGDKHLMYIDGSLASMNLIMALQSMGVATCAINWPDLQRIEKPVRKIIDLQVYERPIMLIAAGYAHPHRMVACSCRKKINEIRTYNH